MPLKIIVQRSREQQRQQPTASAVSTATPPDVPSTQGYALASNVGPVAGDPTDEDMVDVTVEEDPASVPPVKEPDTVEIDGPSAFDVEAAAARDPEGSKLFQKGSIRLAKRYGVHLTPTQLWRVMALFQIQGRQLVIYGLAPHRTLEPSSGAAASSTDASGMSSDEEEGNTADKKNMRRGGKGVYVCGQRALVTSPVQRLLELNGVQMAEEEVGPMLQALRIRPIRMVRLGLLDEAEVAELFTREGRSFGGPAHGHFFDGGWHGRGGGRGGRGKGGRGRVGPRGKRSPPPFHHMDMHHSPPYMVGGPLAAAEHGHHHPPPGHVGMHPSPHMMGLPPGAAEHDHHHPRPGHMHMPHCPPHMMFAPPGACEHGRRHRHMRHPDPAAEHRKSRSFGGRNRVHETDGLHGEEHDDEAYWQGHHPAMFVPPEAFFYGGAFGHGFGRGGGWCGRGGGGPRGCGGRGGRQSMAMVRFVEHRSPSHGDDVAHVTPGQSFKKSWLVRNDSSAPWPEEVSLVPVSRGCQDLSSPSEAAVVGAVAPGEEAEISVDLIAPNQAGMYEGYWRAFGDERKFGQRLWTKVMVVAPAAGGAAGADSDVMNAGVESLSLDDGNKDK